MKRIIILITAFLFSMTLAACDNFTQIQEFSREYCEENPGAEVCELEEIQNLTESEIIQLFNGVLENYNDANYIDFCDDYFSVSNTDLLEQCRAAANELVPDGFEGFSSITYDADASNNYYVITGITMDGMTEVEFRIQVVDEEGGYLISYWIFTSTPVEVTCNAGEVLEDGVCVPEPLVCDEGFELVDGECIEIVVECQIGFELIDGVCMPVDPIDNVTLEEGKLFIEEFISMYLDPNVDSESFCNDYFIDDPEGCIDDRAEGHEMGADIVLDEFTDLGDGVFGAMMSFYEFPGADAKQQFQKFLLTKDELGDIQIEFLDMRVPLDVAAQFFTDLLMDFQNPDIDDAYIINTYFGGFDEYGILEDRPEILLNNITFEVTDWYENEWGEYVLKFIITSPDGTGEEEAPFMVYEFMPGRFVIDIRDDDGGYVDDDQVIFLENMINDYMNPDMPSQEWCDMYFGPEQEEDCAFERDETLALPDFYVMLQFIEERDGWIVIGLEMYDGMNEPMFGEMIVYFYYNDMGIDYVVFEEMHHTDPEQEDFIHLLFETYKDPNWDSLEWCETFFGPDDGTEFNSGCAEDRDNDLQNPDMYVALQYIDYRDGMMFIGVEMQDGEGEPEFAELFVEFIYDDFGIWFVIFHDGDHHVDPDQAEFIYWLFDTYLDPDWGSVEWCNTFFGPEDNPEDTSGCAVDRDEALNNPDFWVHLEWMENYDGMMRIGIMMYDGMEEKYEELFVEFFYDEFGIMYVRFHPGQMNDPMMEELIYGLMNDFNAFDIPSDEVCNFYFEGEDAVGGCIEKREELIQSGGWVQVEYLHAGPYGHEVGFRWFMNGEDYMEDVVAWYYYNEFGEVKLQFEGRHHYEFPWEEAEAILNELLFDFNDQSFSDADFCYKWFPHFDSTVCFLDREMFMGQEFNAYWEWMEHSDQGFRVGIRVEFPQTGEDKYYEIIFAPYYNENGELEIHWWFDHHGYDHDQAMNLVNAFLMDVFDDTLSDDELFNRYSRGEWQKLIDIRNHLLSMGIEGAQLTQFNFHGHSADIEVFVWNGPEEWHEYFHLEFYDIDGVLFFDIYFGEPYFEFPEHEAQDHLFWILSMFNDPNLSNEEACMYMPRIIEDCFAYRDLMFANGMIISLTDFWREWDQGFGAMFEIYNFETMEYEYPYFSFNFWYNHDGTINFDMHTPYPEFRWADYDEALDLWTQWVNDYQDVNMSEEDFANKWFFGHYPEDFFQGRRDQQAAGVMYVIIDFIDDGMMGPNAFRFIIEHHQNGEVLVQEDYVMFRIFEDGTFQIEFTGQHGPKIDIDHAMNIMNMFFTDLRDEFMSAEELCGMYFPMEAQDHCIYLVNDVFRMYADFDYYYFDYYNDHFIMGVDFYDDTFNMVHSMEFFVYFMEGPEGMWYFDLEEWYDPWWEFQPFFEHFDQLHMYLDQYMVDPTVLVEICDLYFYNDPLCGEIDTLFTSDLVAVYNYGFWYEMDEMDNISFYADIYFEYADGTWLDVTYLVYFEVLDDGALRATMEELGRFGGAPLDAVLMDEATTIAVLTEFAIDYSDPNVDAAGLCMVYFMDYMMSPDCLDDREDFLQQGGLAVFLTADMYTDEEGVPYYEVWFDLTVDGVTETVNSMVRVYQLTDNRFFIEFLDWYDGEPDYIHYDMFFPVLMEFVDQYNDASLSDAYICETFYNWPTGDDLCEPDRQTMLAMGSVLVVLDVYEDYSYGDAPVFVITFLYENVDPNMNLEYTVTYMPYYDEYGNIVFDYVPMP